MLATQALEQRAIARALVVRADERAVKEDPPLRRGVGVAGVQAARVEEANVARAQLAPPRRPALEQRGDTRLALIVLLVRALRALARAAALLLVVVVVSAEGEIEVLIREEGLMGTDGVRRW